MKLTSAVRSFGWRNGDGSLRYYGISVAGGRVLERVYRSSHEKTVETLPDDVKAVWNRYFAALSRILDIMICDYSYSVFHGQDSVRLEVILDTSSFDHCCSALNSIEDIPAQWKTAMLQNAAEFRNAFSLANSPLRILGVETDKKGALLNLKYYLYFDKRLSVKTFSDAQQTLLDSFTDRDAPLNSRKLTEALEILKQCEYEPVFVGINHSELVREAKLYFISRCDAHKISALAEPQMRRCISELDLSEYISEEFLASACDHSMLLEGVAYSLKEQNVNRFYWKEIPKQQLK